METHLLLEGTLGITMPVDVMIKRRCLRPCFHLNPGELRKGHWKIAVKAALPLY